MDETGYLDDKWEEAFLITEKNGENKIVFTQKDIREIQLAKAAMRAGMEVLLKHSGIVWDQVDAICRQVASDSMWIWKKRFLPTYFQKLREEKSR